jgi:N-methylhydantoinase B
MQRLAGAFETIRPKQRGIVQGPHDVMEMAWGAGGGVGDPLDRDPQQVADDVIRGDISPEWAHRSFGVVVRDGQLDSFATTAQREEMRRSRLAGRPVSTSAPLIGSGAPRGTFSLWEIVDYTEHQDGTIVAHCARCHAVLSTRDNPSYKGACRVTERDIVDAVPHTPLTGTFIDDRIVLREFCCPGCARQLATEVSRESDDVLIDIDVCQERR